VYGRGRSDNGRNRPKSTIDIPYSGWTVSLDRSRHVCFQRGGRESRLSKTGFVGVVGVSRESEDQVWLTDVILNPAREVQSWLDSVIIDVDASEILSAEFFNDQGVRTLRAVQGEGDENWQLAGGYEGRPLKYSTIVNSIGRALTNLRLVDVALHDPDRWQESHSVKFELKEERMVTILVADLQEQTWLRVEDKAGLPDEAKWDYKVESTRYDEFVKTAEDFLQKQDE